MSTPMSHDALGGAESTSALRLHKAPRVTLIPVPYAHNRLLPKCPSCGDRHPLAYQPPIETDICPSCGGPAAAAGPEVDVPVELAAGLAARAGFGLIGVGQWLKRLVERK